MAWHGMAWQMSVTDARRDAILVAVAVSGWVCMAWHGMACHGMVDACDGYLAAEASGSSFG